MATFTRTAEGRAVLFHVTTGERFERWPVDAREMVATGQYAAENPTAPAASEPGAVPAPAGPEVSPEAVLKAATVVSLGVPGLPQLPKEIAPGVPAVYTHARDVAPAVPFEVPSGRTPKKGK